MISIGMWGAITDDKSEAIDFRKAERKDLTSYVKRSAAYHYRKGGSQTFVSPPPPEKSPSPLVGHKPSHGKS